MKSRHILTTILTLVIFLSPFGGLLRPYPVYANHKESHQQGNSKKNNTKSNNSKKQTSTTSSNSSSNPSNVSFVVTQINSTKTVKTNQNFKAIIFLKNTSNTVLDKNIKIAYHWVDTNGQLEAYRGDDRSFKKPIQPGAEAEITVNVKAPKIPGSFNLVVNLVHNGEWVNKDLSKLPGKEIKVTGSVKVLDDQGVIYINDDAEFTNKSLVNLQIANFMKQPNSENAGFIYEYTQSTISPSNEIEAGNGNWDKWRKIVNNVSTAKLGIRNPFVGDVTIKTRFRAFKKHTTATSDNYGDAMYKNGQANKTSNAYTDTIFFDNVKPNGELLINNGDATTTSRNGDVSISFDDMWGDIEGSGLAQWRWSASCNTDDLASNSWSTWEELDGSAQQVDKTLENIYLGEGEILVVCAQVKDRSGNTSLQVDDILFYVPPPQVLGSNDNPLVPGNISYVDANGNRQVNRLAGTADSPFGEKTSADLGRPKMYVYSEWTLFGNRTHITGIELPPPEITFINVHDDKQAFDVMGVSIEKYSEMDVIITYEIWKDGCYLSELICIERNQKTMQTNLEHVGLVLYERLWWGWRQEINWTWVDKPNGRWTFTMQLDDLSQHDINIDDKIFAKTKAWGSFDSGIPEVGIIDYNSGLVSGNSNEERIIDTQMEKLRWTINHEYGIKVSDGNVDWSEFEMSVLYEVLTETVPKWIFDGYLTEIERKKEYTGPTDKDPGAYAVKELAAKKIEVYNDSKRTRAGFKKLLVHELMHVYQFRYDGSRNDAHTNPDNSSLVKDYYVKVGFNEVPPFTPTGKQGILYYQYGNADGPEDKGDFVSAYAWRGAGSDAPWEEMAESMAYYLIDQSAFTEFDGVRDEIDYCNYCGVKDGDPKTAQLIKLKKQLVANIFISKK